MPCVSCDGMDVGQGWSTCAVFAVWMWGGACALFDVEVGLEYMCTVFDVDVGQGWSTCAL